jgi:peptidoglycan-N-acetylglucosamine deacetylase
LATVKQRKPNLLPGKSLWIAIAALTCAAIAILHYLFNSIPADALIAKTGLPQTIGNVNAIAAKMPMNFDVPDSFQAKTIKDAPVNDRKVIALTFDDGPWPETTEQVLDTLKKENIKATFFVIGQPLKSFPEIGKKLVADGHVIANHTMHHWYHRMGSVVAQREIDDTAKIIKEILNVETAYFRPPGGVLNNGLVDYSHKLKQSVLMWSVDSGDSRPRRPSPEEMTKTVLSQATPGGIVLMHDGGGNHANTARALPGIIKQLRAQGYEFVTIPELLSLASGKSNTPDITIPNTDGLKATPTAT